MTTFTIVDEYKDPLGPNEIHSNATIEPADGDIFIIDPSVNTDIEFTYSGGGTPPAFEIQINADPTDSFSIQILDDLTADISMADNVDATDISLDAIDAGELNFEAGDGVSFGQFAGSLAGINTIVLGDDFTTSSFWEFGSAADTIIVGDNATFGDIDAGGGDDTITFGRDATVVDVNGKSGDDTFTFKSGLTAGKIKGQLGNDTFNIGADADVGEFDGDDGFDTLNTKSPSQTSLEMEATNIVCFANGTLIETPSGPVAAENLSVGQLVITKDHGAQPLRWVGCTTLGFAGQVANLKLRPIRIRAGALGLGIPNRDLYVSPNHRVLIRSPIAQRMCGSAEVFVPAKALTSMDGIDSVIRPLDLRYYHLLLDNHEVLISSNALTESFYLGPQAIRLVGAVGRKQIARLQQQHKSLKHRALARPSIEKKSQILSLVHRHQKSQKPLFTAGAREFSHRQQTATPKRLAC